jgi:hypothetical protein
VSNAGNGGDVNATIPYTWAASDQMAIRFTVPIAEWAGSGTVNVAGNDVEFSSNSNSTAASDTTSFAYGPAGSLIPSITSAATNGAYDKYVKFQTPIQSGDRLSIEIQNGGTGAWIPLETQGRYCSVSRPSGTTKFYGMSLGVIDTTTANVSFGLYGSSFPGTWGNASDNFPIAASDRWRVRKTSASSVAGFSLADTSSAGLVGTGTQTFAGAKTFNSGAAFANTGADSLLLSHYRFDSFTAYLIDGVSGISSAITVRACRIGQIAVLQIPEVTITNTAANRYLTTTNSATTKTWPSWLTPSTITAQAMGAAYKATAASPGVFLVSTTGVFTVGADLLGNNFGTSNELKGITSCSLVYLIN